MIKYITMPILQDDFMIAFYGNSRPNKHHTKEQITKFIKDYITCEHKEWTILKFHELEFKNLENSFDKIVQMKIEIE